MYIRKNIPERVLEIPTTSQFIDVIDGLMEYKQELLSEGLRAFNPAICLDKSWLSKCMTDYGIKDFPFNMPLEVAIQFIHNLDTILGTQGSKIGLELLCSVLSLGDVVIDDSEFFKDSPILVLDSLSTGVIVEDSLDPVFYLLSDSSEITPLRELAITITSRYFNGDYSVEEVAIKSYLEEIVPEFLGFSPNRSITFTYDSQETFKYHSLLNPYFV